LRRSSACPARSLRPMRTTERLLWGLMGPQPLSRLTVDGVEQSPQGLELLDESGWQRPGTSRRSLRTNPSAPPPTSVLLTRRRTGHPAPRRRFRPLPARGPAWSARRSDRPDAQGIGRLAQGLHRSRRRRLHPRILVLRIMRIVTLKVEAKQRPGTQSRPGWPEKGDGVGPEEG
jgi:hypothetical protein